MSYNDYQQNKVNKLLLTDFRKLYELIPHEFKNNYYFERMMFNVAEVYSKLEKAKKSKWLYPDWKTDFEISETNDSITATFDYFAFDSAANDKAKVIVTLKEDKTFIISWSFSFAWNDEKRNSKNIESTYELAMKFNEDKTRIHLEYINESKEDLFKCYFSSIFNTNASELCRVAEAIDTKTNEVLFHEEIMPIGAVGFEKLKEYKQNNNLGSIEVLNINSGIPVIKSVEYEYPQDIKEIYVGKCTVSENTRYMVCWKPNCYANDSYQESFDCITTFGTPTLNLFYSLDYEKRPYVVEIVEEEYNNLMKKSSNSEVPQLKKILK